MSVVYHQKIVKVIINLYFYSWGNLCLDESFQIYFFSVLFYGFLSPSLNKQDFWVSLRYLNAPLIPKKLGCFSPYDFSKNVFSRGSVKYCFFVTFNLFINHIFPENFIKIPQVVQKIWRFSSSILTIFTDISLLQRN